MDEAASAIRQGLLWLERDQERDGHWSDSTSLPRLTATTQALRAFVACGFTTDHRVVKRAMSWLMRSELAADTNHYFWRLGALSELYRSGVPTELIEHDLRVVRSSIDDGVQMDRRLSYRAFLLDCMANIGQGSADAAAYVDHLRDSLTAGNLDVTPRVWAYVALERLDATGGVPLDVEKVAGSLRETNGCYHLNGSVAETSYFVLNCSRSPFLSSHPEMRPVIHGAMRWLVSRQDANAGNWPTEQPLYSGNPQTPAYYTALACRALLAYLERYQPRSLAQVALPDWILRRRVAVIAARTSVAAITCLALMASGLFLVPGVAGRLVTGSGVVGTVLSAVAFSWEARARYGRGRRPR